jgi:hypothetical protein
VNMGAKLYLKGQTVHLDVMITCQLLTHWKLLDNINWGRGVEKAFQVSFYIVFQVKSKPYRQSVLCQVKFDPPNPGKSSLKLKSFIILNVKLVTYVTMYTFNLRLSSCLAGLACPGR